MAYNDEVKVPKWLAGVILTALVTFVGWIWTLRSSTIEDLTKQIDTYKESEKWKLPETLNKINLASEKLSLNIDDKNELSQGRKEIQQLTVKNEELQRNLETSKKSLQAVNDALNKIALKNDSFTVYSRDSFPVVNNMKYISVKIIGYNSVSGIFEDQSYDIDVGSSLSYKVGTLSCRITLVKMSSRDDYATFNRSCLSNN